MRIPISVADEATFKQFARRIHKALKAREPTTVPPLGHIQEAVIRALGHRSLHEARQGWAQVTPSETASPPAAPVAAAPEVAWEMPSAWRAEIAPVQDELLRDAARDCHDRLRGYHDEAGNYREHDLPANLRPVLAALKRIWRERKTLAQAQEAEARRVLKPGEAPRLSDRALQALAEGLPAWDAWLQAHAIAVPHLWGLNRRGEPVPLADLVAGHADDLVAYWQMMDAVRAAGGALAPLPRHLALALGDEETWWDRADGWYRFAQDLPQALLLQGAKTLWHASYHYQYQAPPEAWAQHRPWQFLQAIQRRLGQVPEWLHGSWLWRSHQWDAFLAWQAKLDSKHWWDADRRAMAEAALEAAHVGQIPVLARILDLPDFEWETRTPEGYTRDLRSSSLPRKAAKIALAQDQRDVLAWLRDRWLAAGEWERLPDEWIYAGIATANGLATWWAVDGMTLAQKSQALVAWMVTLLNQLGPDTSLLSTLADLARSLASDPAHDGWPTVVQQVFLRQFEVRRSSALRPKERQAFQQRLRYLIGQGAHWPTSEGNPLWAAWLADEDYQIVSARLLHRLGADLTQPDHGQSVLAWALDQQPTQDLQAWARLGVSIAPTERFRHWLATTLAPFTQPTRYDDLVAALQAGWPVTGLSEAMVQAQWDLIRHPVQMAALAAMTPSRPTGQAIMTWLDAPAKEFGLTDVQRDPYDRANSHDVDAPLRHKLALVLEAKRLGATLDAGDGCILHAASWMAKYDEEDGVALIDALVAMGADPLATNSEGETADVALNSYPISISVPVLDALRRHRGRCELALKYA